VPGTWKSVVHGVKPDDPSHASLRGEGFCKCKVRLPGRTVTARSIIGIEADM
jgi:hypothetical protein